MKAPSTAAVHRPKIDIFETADFPTHLRLVVSSPLCVFAPLNYYYARPGSSQRRRTQRQTYQCSYAGTAAFLALQDVDARDGRRAGRGERLPLQPT